MRNAEGVSVAADEMTPHEGLDRLFQDYDLDQLLRPEHHSFLAARILEEGDTRDLLWLKSRLGEPRLRTWLTASGGRQLSRRSLRFWRLILLAEDDRSRVQAEKDGQTEVAREIWPL